MTTTLSSPRQSLAWLGLAALLGFAVPLAFSTGLRWQRALFLVPYVVLVGAFLVAFFRRNAMGWREFVGYWPYAAVGVLAAGFLLLRNIQGQPPSAAPQGGELGFALLWLTAAYHLGYVEFQGPALAYVLVGNVIITSAFLLTGSAAAAVLTHVAMHVAAVFHGMETTLQLPPHYG